jgi:hypothetical protein
MAVSSEDELAAHLKAFQLGEDFPSGPVRRDSGERMSTERYLELSEGDESGPNLTEEEIAAGWHFCVEFDGALIHPDWEEAESCRCHENKKEEP